jgi:integrase
VRRAAAPLDERVVHVTRQLSEVPGGGYAYGPPKSDAGQRVVQIPDLIVPDLERHLASTGPADEALVFTSPTGAPLRHSNFRRRVWLPALNAARLPLIHFHDLRHTGNKLTADAGANLRELMERMGHSSTRAALIYLHSTSERQRIIADAVGAAAREALRKTKQPGNARGQSGTEVARRRERVS